MLAARAQAAGVERIGVDLERLGKRERQRGLGTWISPHTEDDLRRVGGALDGARLFARVNPLNPDSAREIESVLDCGAEVLMLPMVASGTEAQAFVNLVAGRAHVVLLVECAEAVRRLAELVEVEGVDEVHIGLNDLALSLGLANRWLVLAGELAYDIGARVLEAGLRFGLGGIGRAADMRLPVPADLVYAEYARTGATAALVSRSFFQNGHADDLAGEIARARGRLELWRQSRPEELSAAHAELASYARRATSW